MSLPYRLTTFTQTLKWAEVVFLIIYGVLSINISPAWHWNLRALTLIKGETTSFTNSLPAECAHIWLASAEIAKSGPLTAQRQLWKQALECSVNNLQQLQVFLPEDQEMARLATQLYPGYAETWFWLAKSQIEADPEQAIFFYWEGLQIQPGNSNAWIQLSLILSTFDSDTAMRIFKQLNFTQTESDTNVVATEMKFILAAVLSKEYPDEAIRLYREGLQAKPRDGVRWYQLGDLLAKTDIQGALAAYLQSCYNGDPGSNGCYRAGRMAEANGDAETAIEYYRLSRYSGALERADQLERELQSIP